MVRALLRIFFILSIPAAIAVGTFFVLRRTILSPMHPEATTPIIVEVPAGKPFSEIAGSLNSQGVVRSSLGLQILAKAIKADTRIKAGEYEVSASMTPRQILEKLMSGEVVRRVVSIAPGMTINDIPPIVQQQGLLSADEFGKSLRDPALLARAGISASSFEGYLFPDSYQFSRPITPWQIIIRLLENGESKWKPEFQAKADELRLSRHEVLTLGSMIEKETSVADERAVISSVFHNRLKQGMKLQSNPTVLYGLENHSGELTDEDFKNGHPYNTYVHLGLPLGPIANPSLESITAALFPAETTYLFYVNLSDGTGRHAFSQTYREHQEALNKLKAAGLPLPASPTVP